MVLPYSGSQYIKYVLVLLLSVVNVLENCSPGS